MSNFYLNISEIKINYSDIQHAIENPNGWQEITPEHENHGYVQYYKKYEPKWLTDQLLPIWSYMGILIACRAGEYLLPHVDTGRTAGILIPCTKSYEENTLDFWDIPEWKGTIGKQQKFHNHNNGKIIESVKYTTPILFKNVPHGVDNRTSTFDRINLSVCFMEPYTFEVVSDLYQKSLLIK
jgi:hypothetical protein